MKLSRLIAIILVSAMLMTALFSCTDKGDKGNGEGKNPLTAEECLNKIMEKTFPEIEATTVSTEVKIVSTGAVDPFNRIVFKSIVSPTAESVVSLEVVDPSGSKADMIVYSGNSGAVVSSRLFEGNYLVSVEFLKELLDGLGQMGEAAGDVFTGGIGGAAQDPELVKTVEKYMKVLESSVSSAAEKKLVIKGESLGVTVEFNGDSVKKVIKDVYNEAKKDETLKELILEAAASADPEGYNKFVSEYERFFASEDGLNELFNDINECGDLNLEFTVTADKSFTLSSFDASLEVDCDFFSFAYATNTADNETATTVTVEYSDGETLENGKYVLTESTVTEDDGVEYTLELDMDGQTVPVVSYTCDAEGVYLLDLLGQASVEGTYVAEDNKTVITVQKVTVSGETMIMNITVTTEENVTLPAFPTDYKTLAELAKEELDALVDGIKNDKVVSALYEYYAGLLESMKGQQGEALPDEL